MHRTVIRPARGWVPIDLGDLWSYRELLVFLTWRDIKVKYKQTAIGAAWAILQPVLTMLVFTVFFGRLAKIPSDGVPYSLFALTGLIPWQLFATALATSSTSIVTNKNLIAKVYFPRLIVPIAAVLAGLVDFAVSAVVLLGMMLWWGVKPGPAMVVLPFAIVLALLTALAVGLWLSALNVRYRDVQYTIPFVIQIWQLLSPIAYPTSLVPERFRIFYSLNPMVGVVDAFRYALLGGGNRPGLSMAVSAGMVVVVLLGGLLYFRRAEKAFADVL